MLENEVAYYNITWIANDTDPENWGLYINGTPGLGDTWFSGVPVVIYMDGVISGPGLYNFTIVFTDLLGNIATSTVWVTVEPVVQEYSQIIFLSILFSVTSTTYIIRRKIRG